MKNLLLDSLLSKFKIRFQIYNVGGLLVDMVQQTIGRRCVTDRRRRRRRVLKVDEN